MTALCESRERATARALGRGGDKHTMDVLESVVAVTGMSTSSSAKGLGSYSCHLEAGARKEDVRARSVDEGGGEKNVDSLEVALDRVLADGAPSHKLGRSRHVFGSRCCV